ncbi:MAG TPA: DUF4743 domain-containing protein [Stellaceae bacterium]|nr:DUF4743 domain-containing protein [Stellaceae bacterium]
MNLLRHIDRCNRFAPERFLPLWREGTRIGFIRRHDHAPALARFPKIFATRPDGIHLIAQGGFDALSAAVDEVVEALIKEGLIPKWRNEFFAVAGGLGSPPLLKLDRGAVSFFGTRAYGVHLNGFRRKADKIELWIGRRAADKKVSPNKLDNMVAGGIPWGHGILSTLVKEAEEEAGMAADLTREATFQGFLSYRMEVEGGARDDVLYLYDLEVPGDFVPENRDGEIASFAPMPAEEVIARVSASEDFKFNVNLVLIDFALRHGLVRPDDPDYPRLMSGLHPSLDRAF